jgi:hypothetical protein
MNDMTQLKKETHSNPDDRLADFTDQVLEGKLTQTASTADEELLALEETVLRLNKAFPPVQLPEASGKQMQVRLNARMKREAEKPTPSLLERWFGIGNIRPQFAMAFAAVAVLVLLAVLLPGTTTGSSTTATAFSSSPGLVAGIALVVIVLVLWIMRRK